MMLEWNFLFIAYKSMLTVKEIRLYTVYLLPQTALNVSGGDTSNHQKHI